ncbi:MAG: RNA pyrophosphohydrolase [Candidatus Competibacteraceae bacterium]
MIDSEGFRPNVGIILCNEEGRLFWAKRIGQHSWQFPQGGIQWDESPEQAMFRELTEETGLRPEHVQVIGCTKGWLRYRLPKRLVRRGGKPICIGQKQIWFLLRMLGDEGAVRLDLSERPEFDHWQWVDYWYPLRAVVPFKRHVYWRALRELAPLLFADRWSEDLLAEVQAFRRRFRNLETLDLGPGPPPLPVRPARSEPAGPVAPKQRLDPVRPSAVRPAVVLPLRRTDLGQHPVITRMVVATRRRELLDTATPKPALESPAKVASLDEVRSPRAAASDPYRLSRR